MSHTASETHRFRWKTSETSDIYDSPTPDSVGELHHHPKSAVTSVERARQDGSQWNSNTEQHEQVIDEQVVEVFKTVADTLVAAFETNLSAALREQITAWCALHGFESIESETSRTIVARQAVFNLWLKTTLYEWHHQYGDLPTLSTNPRDAFRCVKNRTENPAFDEYVLDDVIRLADETALEAVVAERHRLLQSTQPAEDIGRLYEALIPNDSRRTLGQFRTPPQVGTLIRRWAVSGDGCVLDPGIGAGVLSSPFHPQWKVSTDPAHVDGIDRSPLSLLMGTTALTLAGQHHEPHRADFLAYSPDDLTRDVDAIVCNPPYTRHQSLPADYKTTINAQAEQKTGLDISTASPLYAYFIYHARTFLTAGNRAAFITPHHFLAADYGDALKQFLLSEFDIKAFLLFTPTNEPVFDGALTTGLITFLEVPDESEASECTRFIRVDNQLDEIPVREIVRDGQQGRTDWGFVNCIRQEDLVAAENWESLFEPLEVDTSKLTPLSEIAEVSRGILTGENDFFMLSQADVDEWELQEQYLSRVVPGPKTVRGYDFRSEDWNQHQDQAEAVWLLYHLEDIDGVPQTIEAAESGCPAEVTLTPETASSASLIEYLQAGLVESETLTERQTVCSRLPWYRVDRRDPAPILVPYMYRSGFRALLNETDARYVNNYLGIYPDASLGRTQVKALLAYLNSSFANEVVRRHNRTYAGGMDKLEPGDLADVPVLDPRSLSDDVVIRLAHHFDDLRDTARGDDSCVEVVEQIDTVLQQEL